MQRYHPISRIPIRHRTKASQFPGVGQVVHRWALPSCCPLSSRVSAAENGNIQENVLLHRYNPKSWWAACQPKTQRMTQVHHPVYIVCKWFSNCCGQTDSTRNIHAILASISRNQFAHTNEPSSRDRLFAGTVEVVPGQSDLMFEAQDLHHDTAHQAHSSQAKILAELLLVKWLALFWALTTWISWQL